MNQKGTQSRLQSLAHPLISLGEKLEEAKEGLFLPPFPEINLNWHGFCLSHLNWLGIKHACNKIWQADLNSRHELYHQDLGFTPFSLLKKHEVTISYNLILKTIVDRQEQVQVPMKPDYPLSPPLLLDAIQEDRDTVVSVLRSNLQKQLATIVLLHELSNMCEEVYVIRSSLISARVTHSHRQKLTAIYKEAYGKVMPEFPVVYDAFDFVARKIGETAARSIIRNVFTTIFPTDAFLTILNVMCEFDSTLHPKEFVWNLTDKQTDDIKNFSREEVDGYFGWILSQIDPLNFRFRRIDVASHTIDIKQRWSTWIQDVKDTEDNFLELVFGLSPNTYLYTQYSHDRNPFPHIAFPLFCKVEDLEKEVIITKNIYYGSLTLLLEAIRQQLTQGIGLLCPFWSWNHTCCSRRNKEHLEKVWECTSDSVCGRWKRLGCLAKRTCAKDQRKRAKTSKTNG